MELVVELSRLVLKDGPRRIIGIPLHLNMAGSVKASPVLYLLGRFRRLYFEDPRFGEVAAVFCRDCVAENRGDAIVVDRRLVVEAYYNTVAQDVLALAPGIDSVVVPCYTGALGEAVAKRVREVEPGIFIIAVRLGGGDCSWADAAYEPPPPPSLPKALNLGGASVAALSVALKASEERGLYSTLALLTDGKT
ncbi:MAG: hypothetical protein QXP98_10265 [Thermoproteus sp.]